jgi:Rod binding domain-containing protein
MASANHSVQGLPLTAANYSAFGRVQRQAGSANSPAALKLRKAAAEFESTLIANLWKSMKSSFASHSSEDDSSDPSHDVLEDWGIQAMSTAVATAGGLGIGRLILKDLEPKLDACQNGNRPATGKASLAPADIYSE